VGGAGDCRWYAKSPERKGFRTRVLRAWNKKTELGGARKRILSWAIPSGHVGWETRGTKYFRSGGVKTGREKGDSKRRKGKRGRSIQGTGGGKCPKKGDVQNSENQGGLKEKEKGTLTWPHFGGSKLPGPGPVNKVGARSGSRSSSPKGRL